MSASGDVGLRRLSRRSVIAGALVIGAGALLAACGSGAAVTTASSSAPAATSASQAASGTTVAQTSSASASSASASSAVASTSAAPVSYATTAAATSSAAATPVPAAQGASGAATTLTWGGWADTVQMGIFNDIIAAYQKANPTIKVNAQFAPWSDYWQKVQTQLASNTAPDLIEMSVAYIGNFVAKNVVLNLDSYVQTRKLDLGRYWPVDVATWRFAAGSKVGGQGPLYALSYDASINSTFFYNKTLFDKAKLPYPTDSWTWEKDVLPAAKALTDTAGQQWGMLAPYVADGAWTSLVWEWGGDTISSDYSKGTLSQPEALAALQFIYDLVYTQKVSPPPDSSAKVPPFTTGKFAMYFSNCDCEISSFKKITSFEWDVARWPAGPKGRVVEMEPDGHAITKATKQPDQTFDFLKFVVYDDDGILRQSTYGTLPAVQALAQSDKYLKQPGFPAGKYLQLKDIVEGSRENYFGQGWAEWEDKSDKALQQAWLSKKSAADAAKDADAAIDSVLQHLGGSLF